MHPAKRSSTLMPLIDDHRHYRWADHRRAEHAGCFSAGERVAPTHQTDNLKAWSNRLRAFCFLVMSFES